MEKVVQKSKLGIPFDEFKLVYESAERVTDRRLELNRTNSSLCSLVLAGMGAMLAWGYGKADVLAISIAAAGLIAALGIGFCRWWIMQVAAYKDLNGAKFEVLAEMSDHLIFQGYEGSGVRSSKPFSREWEILQNRKELQRYKKSLALASTSSEFVVPWSFMIFFSVILVGVIGLGLSKAIPAIIDLVSRL